MTYRVKDVKRMYKFVGYEEKLLQEFDFGVVTGEFCLLWKDGQKINKKIIRELLKIKDEVEIKDKKHNQQTKQTVQTGSGDVLKKDLKSSGKSLKVKTVDNNKNKHAGKELVG